MITQDAFLELIEIANAILVLEADEEHNRETGQWKKAKKDYDTLEEALRSKSGTLVDGLLSSEDAHLTAEADFLDHIAEVRAQADPSWHPAIDKVEAAVLPKLTKEAAKSPRMRKTIKALPWIAAILVAIGYFGTRIVLSNDISEPLESQQGIQQRAAAVEKVLRYDDWMGTRVRRGGWLKGVILWPIEPTDDEIDGAAEFLGLSFEVADFATSEFGCRSLLRGYGDELSDSELTYLSDMAARFSSSDIIWDDPAFTTVLREAREVQGC